LQTDIAEKIILIYQNYSMRSLYWNTLVIIVLLLSSCKTEPVDVVIDRMTDDSSVAKIVIDGKITLRFTGDSTTAIKLKPGSHFVQVNDSAKQHFEVGEKGGILNLSREEYVVYPIKYTSGGSNSYSTDIYSMHGPSSAILIDSFVITSKTLNPISADRFRNIAKELTDGPDSTRFPNPTSLHKIGKGKLFIDKAWDYSMTDSIPETVEIRSSSSYNLNTSTVRTSILRSRSFLFAVLLTEQDEFVVKSLSEIREGKTDEKEGEELKEEKVQEKKKDDKDVKSKQMKF
jgi:hypothetical protein